MAKRAEKVADGPPIARTVWVPTWGYNFLVERATRQPWRNIKAELSGMLERALREEMKAEGKEPGKLAPVRKAA